MDYRAVRRRLRGSLTMGSSVEHAIRSELEKAGAGSCTLGLAMLIAVLRMPDVYRAKVHAIPLQIDRRERSVIINNVAFSVRYRAAQVPPPLRSASLCVKLPELYVMMQELGDHSDQGEADRVDLPNYIALIAVLRAGGIRNNLEEWISRVREP